MTIAVDFDGTIVEHKYPEIGKERPFAIESLKRLSQKGHRLILWTAREGELLEDAVNFCRERGLEFYAVNSDGPLFEGEINARKLRVDLFIDDRNLGGLPDWPTIYDMVNNHLTFGDLIERARGGDDDEPGESRNFFQRIADRCRESREKVGGEQPRSRGHSVHHW